MLNALTPTPAPNWPHTAIIRTIMNDTGRFKRIQLNLASTSENNGISDYPLIRMVFKRELLPEQTQPAPISLRYYTNNIIRHANTPTMPIQVQIDGGANRSVTNDPTLLAKFQKTPTYPIYGISKEDVALTCTGKGLQFAHIPTSKGNITFYQTEGTNHIIYPLRMHNGLWYNDSPIHKQNQLPHAKTSSPTGICCHLSAPARYELWHHRCVHSGNKKLNTLHKHVEGVGDPLKGNTFWLCLSCIHSKQSARALTSVLNMQILDDKKIISMNLLEDGDWLQLISPIDNEANLQPGEVFHMDFGFPRWTDPNAKSGTAGRLLASIDGYRAYFLVLDRKTRFCRGVCTVNKHRPVKFMERFLEIHGHKEGRCIIRTDKGGELWGSFSFREAVIKVTYLLEPTAPDAAFQNAHCERLNGTFGCWMRCILHASNLGPEFWSFAFLHTIQTYNMLPHSTIGMTPYFALTGRKPTSESFHVFGCNVFVKKNR
jgi:hypothetical protein